MIPSRTEGSQGLDYPNEAVKSRLEPGFLQGLTSSDQFHSTGLIFQLGSGKLNFFMLMSNTTSLESFSQKQRASKELVFIFELVVWAAV